MVEKKRSVLMLCAHVPSVDPRIRWEAQYASSEFDVTVLGFAPSDTSINATSDDGYRTILVQHCEMSASKFFVRLIGAMPFLQRLLAGALAAVFLPVLSLAEIALYINRAFVRRPGRVGGVVWRARAADFRPNHLVFRLIHIVALLRDKFSPAAVLLWDAIRNEGLRPDVVHCNDLDSLLVGVVAKQTFGAALIYDAHEFYPYSDPHGRWLDTVFFMLIERLLIRKADKVVTVNPMLAQEMKLRYGLPAAYAVPNAEPWTGNPTSPAPSSMSKLAGNRVKFLFQGRFSPERGIEELVMAWKHVDVSKAALFLRGPENPSKQAVRNLAEGLELLNTAVYFLDPVKEDMLVHAAAEADVGLIPYKPFVVNDRYCCPNKLSQYLHAGLMIITNDLQYVRSVVDDAQAGLSYDSHDLTTLVTAVQLSAADPDMLRRYKMNALSYAREKFNWQVQMEVLHALYRTVPVVGL